MTVQKVDEKIFSRIRKVYGKVVMPNLFVAGRPFAHEIVILKNGNRLQLKRIVAPDKKPEGCLAMGIAFQAETKRGFGVGALGAPGNSTGVPAASKHAAAVAGLAKTERHLFFKS